MMPLVKQTAQIGLAKPGGGYPFVCGILYAHEPAPVFRLPEKNILPALEEAARDGASTWETYWKIIFPIMKPMHATAAVLTALGTWNDVMTPLVIMSGTGHNTLRACAAELPDTVRGTNYNRHSPLTC